MCLSRATESRPVQPAMTAWSIANVSGVVVSWASTVKVRSNTNYGLRAGSKLEYTTVGSTRASQHQADGNVALTMCRQRDGTAVDHVDQGAIAQGAQVFRGERLVVGEIGDLRRGVGGCRQHQRVIGRDACIHACDQRAALVEEIDVVSRALRLAAHDAHGDSGIVDVAFGRDEITVPGEALGRGKTALGIHRPDVVE